MVSFRPALLSGSFGVVPARLIGGDLVDYSDELSAHRDVLGLFCCAQLDLSSATVHGVVGDIFDVSLLSGIVRTAVVGLMTFSSLLSVVLCFLVSPAIRFSCSDIFAVPIAGSL